MRKPLEGVQQRLLSILDKGFLKGVMGECYHPAGTPGRKPRNPIGQLKTLILQRLLQIPSTEALVRRLYPSPRLKALCGLEEREEPWHPSTLNKLRQRLRSEQRERLNHWVIGQLREIGAVDGSVLAVDETFIPAYSCRNPENTRVGFSDREASLRRHDHRSLFGYGVMVAVDAESELPVAVVVTPANTNEKKVAPSLLERTLRHRGLRRVVADKQYSSRRFRETAMDRGVEPVIPYPSNQRRGEKGVLRVDRNFHTHGPERLRHHYRSRTP